LSASQVQSQKQLRYIFSSELSSLIPAKKQAFGPQAPMQFIGKLGAIYHKMAANVLVSHDARYDANAGKVAAEPALSIGLLFESSQVPLFQFISKPRGCFLELF
jgi:hypothetical protein